MIAELPFNYCVAQHPYTDCNPAAHGNRVYVVRCDACGAERTGATNGRHSEVGTWALPPKAKPIAREVKTVIRPGQWIAVANASDNGDRGDLAAVAATEDRAYYAAIDAGYHPGVVRVGRAERMRTPRGAEFVGDDE
jgi:hypothetical protein